MITIVIPIIKFNDYSRKVMSELGQSTAHYDALKFLFAVSDDVVAGILRAYLVGFPNNYKILTANNYSSNFLRGLGRTADTDHVYFQDCDDYADYEQLNLYARGELPMDQVLCFNVIKRFYNNEGKVVKERALFNIKEGVIKDIEVLPTCVYSKIIPTVFLRQIEFPNLPYSQDWAIAYQLFFLGTHRYTSRSTYIYNNYPSSSSAKMFAKVYGTNRVNCWGRSFCDKLCGEGYQYESDILNYKYSIMLTDVYNSMGVRFFRAHLTWRMFVQHFRPIACMGYIYHTLRTIRCVL